MYLNWEDLEEYQLDTVIDPENLKNIQEFI